MLTWYLGGKTMTGWGFLIPLQRSFHYLKMPTSSNYVIKFLFLWLLVKIILISAASRQITDKIKKRTKTIDQFNPYAITSVF